MTAIARTPDRAWLTPELQQQLLVALSSGLKPRWVAFRCGVSPKALTAILEAGSKRDAEPALRSFCVRWVRVEAELMEGLAARSMGGDKGAADFLRERWPKAWGKDAEPDYEPLGTTTSNAEELEQLESILAAPDAYGLAELFAKHGWARTVA